MTNGGMACIVSRVVLVVSVCVHGPYTYTPYWRIPFFLSVLSPERLPLRSSRDRSAGVGRGSYPACAPGPMHSLHHGECTDIDGLAQATAPTGPRA